MGIFSKLAEFIGLTQKGEVVDLKPAEPVSQESPAERYARMRATETNLGDPALNGLLVHEIIDSRRETMTPPPACDRPTPAQIISEAGPQRRGRTPEV